MHYEYRLTRYDPSLRDANGAYTVDDWMSYSDIGRTFRGKKLTRSAYHKTEDGVVLVLNQLLAAADVHAMYIRDLEYRGGVSDDRRKWARSRGLVSVATLEDLIRLILRESLWARLELPRRAFLHFGYDYYTYIGLSRCVPQAASLASLRGLYLEPFRSPYVRTRSQRV